VWLQILQAFALLAISAAGAVLAWQQVRIADAKLQHDLYDRRFKVFDATRRMLASTPPTLEHGFRPENLGAFVADTADAIFLFDDEIAKYLEEMKARAFRFQSITEALPKGEDREKYLNEIRERRAWFYNQLVALPYIFEPFLKLDRRRREAGGWQATTAWFRRHILRRRDS
jgi:hypothetical protein